MFALLLIACNPAPPPPAPLPVGFHEVGIDAIVDEMASTQARPRVYNFWATWCAPCMQELPELREFSDARNDVDLVLVNVDTANVQQSRVRPVLQRLHLDQVRSLGLADPDPVYALGKLEGWPNSLPVTMVVSASGERTGQFNVSVTRDRLDRAIDELVHP
ncbi:MAG: TlpA disulfide reductase family protein [Myxococcota bacterium]